jgi:hypothetical protein
MALLMVPDDGQELWPTLGPQVCDFIENYLVYGPGDLRGQPVQLAMWGSADPKLIDLRKQAAAKGVIV